VKKDTRIERRDAEIPSFDPGFWGLATDVCISPMSKLQGDAGGEQVLSEGQIALTQLRRRDNSGCPKR